MKKSRTMLTIRICATAFLLCIAILASCSSQWAAKTVGGDVTLDLEPGQKLVEITWKDDSLWYLTKPMLATDIAEVYTFQQSSNWDVFEGTVTVHEYLPE